MVRECGSGGSAGGCWTRRKTALMRAKSTSRSKGLVAIGRKSKTRWFRRQIGVLNVMTIGLPRERD